MLSMRRISGTCNLWLIGFVWLVLGGHCHVYASDPGGRFSLTGSVMVRSIDGNTNAWPANINITSPRLSHVELIQSNEGYGFHNVSPDPYGFNLSSRLFVGGSFQINMRLWRRLELALALEGYTYKKGEMELNWSNTGEILVGDVRATVNYESKFYMADWRLLLEYHLSTYGIFFQAGFERLVYGIDERFTRNVNDNGTLLSDASSWRQVWYGGNGAVIGAGWSHPLARRLNLIVASTFVTGDMTGGIRITSGIRYRL